MTNIPKGALLFIGLGVASFVVWNIFAALRAELSSELNIHQWYQK